MMVRNKSLEFNQPCCGFIADRDELLYAVRAVGSVRIREHPVRWNQIVMRMGVGSEAVRNTAAGTTGNRFNP
jgi:hypothetical protein